MVIIIREGGREGGFPGLEQSESVSCEIKILHVVHRHGNGTVTFSLFGGGGGGGGGRGGGRRVEEEEHHSAYLHIMCIGPTT